MRCGALILAALVLVGCGKKLGPGKTPKETIRNLERAIQTLDLGATYAMSSARVRDQLDRAMDGLKAAVKMLPEEIVDEMGWDGVEDKSTREILNLAIDRLKDQMPEAVKAMKSLQMIVMDVKTWGNEAQVEVSVLFRGSEQTTRVPMVKENGFWVLDSNDTLSGLPVDFTVPSPEACVTPT